MGGVADDVATKVEKLIVALPKAELHLHIEGTLEPEMLLKLAEKNNVSVPYKTVEEIRTAYNFSNLQSFLDLYYQGMSVLLHREDFAELAYAYTCKMHANHIRHAEVFFDPQCHLSRGVAFETVYDGLHEGFLRGEAEFGITFGFIFSFLRDTPEETCLAMLQDDSANGDAIRKGFAQGAFVAIGLDSAELQHPPQKFSRLFQYCRETLKVPCAVAHAGEEGPSSYIWTALKELLVQRIDHGVAAEQDPALLTFLRESRTPLTVCPLSNVKLNVFPNRAACAEAVLKLLRQDNLCVTVNSDDPAYFQGYLNHNYAMLNEGGSLTLEDVAQLAKNSFRASFVPEEMKTYFYGEIDEIYNVVSKNTSA